MISVIIPTYNNADTIAACLTSLFAQTMRDVEVIVVNDGSTDGTLIALAPFVGRIRIITQENQGSNAARNRGRSEARGEYLLFLDADITMHSSMLAQLRAALDAHAEASYAYASFRYGLKRFRLGPFDPDRLRRMPFIPTTTLVRAKDFPKFDPAVRRLQDWDVWLTMLEQGKYGVWVPQVLFTAAPRAQGISQWVPRWVYWIPWRILGFKPKQIVAYEEAVRRIKQKHHLS